MLNMKEPKYFILQAWYPKKLYKIIQKMNETAFFGDKFLFNKLPDGEYLITRTHPGEHRRGRTVELLVKKEGNLTTTFKRNQAVKHMKDPGFWILVGRQEIPKMEIL